jgi:hypothetical protein
MRLIQAQNSQEKKDLFFVEQDMYKRKKSKETQTSFYKNLVRPNTLSKNKKENYDKTTSLNKVVIKTNENEAISEDEDFNFGEYVLSEEVDGEYKDEQLLNNAKHLTSMDFHTNKIYKKGITISKYKKKIHFSNQAKTIKYFPD